MPISSSRRQLLKTGAWGAAALGLGGLDRFLGQLGPVHAQEAMVSPGAVRFRPEIEPLVRLIEDTPRARLLEEVGARVRKGLPYRDVVAALMLAGVRNVRPGPVVGAKLHCVLVLNSAHLGSQASPPEDRWLPIFWALDEFKHSQARDIREGDWIMPALDDSALPPPERAAAALTAALDAWDPEAADRAAAALAKSARLDEIYELLWRYGARDYRDIGHKIIYVANSYRTLQTIGVQHAEGVLRSLARALVVFRGTTWQSDARMHRPWQENQPRIAALRAGWQHGRDDDDATRALLATLRQASSDQASAAVLATLNAGVSPRSVWDAYFAFAAELVMQRPSIPSLHAQTATNAFAFAFRTARSDRTRRELILQNAGFLSLYREDTFAWRNHFARLETRDEHALRGQRIDQLEAPADAPPATVDDVFADLGRDRARATRKLLAALDAGLDPQQVIRAARLLLFAKGDNPHDYKFSEAILEDAGHISPAWRPRFLAASLSLLRSSEAEDNPLNERTRRIFAA